MNIKKFEGKTKDEAIAAAKAEMGPNVVIMNVKEVRAKGFLGMLGFKPGIFEVTAAIEESGAYVSPGQAFAQVSAQRKSFDAVADDSVEVATEKSDDWAGALSEIGKIVKISEENVTRKQNEILEPKSAPSRATNIIKAQPTAKPKLNPAVIKPEHEDEESEIELGLPKHEQRKNAAFLKMIYNTLLDNEVNEKYINQIMDDVEKIMQDNSSVDYIVSNTYQKMVLKLGKPCVIEGGSKGPRVVFFIGPTGVGKTTTIAKLASKFQLEENKKVALLTADTYRIAAVEQLKTYAGILGVPLNIVYSPEDLAKNISNYDDYDLIMIDTAGFSHKSENQKNDMRTLIDSLPANYDKSVYLVLSATTKYKDLMEIADTYKEISDYDLIFTKLDETNTYGNILNIKLYTGSGVSYVTTGQNVPDDIEVIDTQKIVTTLLGGQ